MGMYLSGAIQCVVNSVSTAVVGRDEISALEGTCSGVARGLPVPQDRALPGEQSTPSGRPLRLTPEFPHGNTGRPPYRAKRLAGRNCSVGQGPCGPAFRDCGYWNMGF